MDVQNLAPRGDWKGDHEEGTGQGTLNKMKNIWKGEKPMRADDMEENRRLRRDLGQSPTSDRK